MVSGPQVPSPRVLGPSMVTASVMMGNAEVRLMVWSPAPMLKQMVSAPALPFALVIASRNEPAAGVVRVRDPEHGGLSGLRHEGGERHHPAEPRTPCRNPNAQSGSLHEQSLPPKLGAIQVLEGQYPCRQQKGARARATRKSSHYNDLGPY